MLDATHEFLVHAGWAEAEVQPLAGDLSARRYSRLSLGQKTAVLMDARALPESVAPFLQMTQWLRDQGLSAPAVLAEDSAQALLLLEDLGPHPVTRMLEASETRDAALEVAIDLLLALRRATPPALDRPDPKTLCNWTRLVDDFYPGADTTWLDAIRSVLVTVFEDLHKLPATLSLRDFHADNLIWMPQRQGIARLGLLDYQDAFLTHPAYDLVSLLTDARTQIAPDTRARYIARNAQLADDDPEDLARAFAAFSVQRNLRILGIFLRSAKLDGKTHHLPKLPRVYGYLREALEHPVFAALQNELPHALPAPEALP